MTSIQPELSVKAQWISATVGADEAGGGVVGHDDHLGVDGDERSAGQEGEQVLVELALVIAGQAVRRAGVDLERGVGQQR